MARVGRWRGAIVVEDGGVHWLVGHPKEPCPEVPETLDEPWVKRLSFAPPLTDERAAHDDYDNGEATARRLADRLLIRRNGSVSERLWRLVTHEGASSMQWLIEMPAHVWDLVRDAVLRCS